MPRKSKRRSSKRRSSSKRRCRYGRKRYSPRKGSCRRKPGRKGSRSKRRSIPNSYMVGNTQVRCSYGKRRTGPLRGVSCRKYSGFTRKGRVYAPPSQCFVKNGNDWRQVNCNDHLTGDQLEYASKHGLFIPPAPRYKGGR